jgi:hypothetical protein
MTAFPLQPCVNAPCTLGAQNHLNRTFYGRLEARSIELLFTQIELSGVAWVRFACGTEWTEERHVPRAFDMLCEEAAVAMNSVRNLYRVRQENGLNGSRQARRLHSTKTLPNHEIGPETRHEV